MTFCAIFTSLPSFYYTEYSLTNVALYNCLHTHIDLICLCFLRHLNSRIGNCRPKREIITLGTFFQFSTSCFYVVEHNFVTKYILDLHFLSLKSRHTIHSVSEYSKILLIQLVSPNSLGSVSPTSQQSPTPILLSCFRMPNSNSGWFLQKSLFGMLYPLLSSIQRPFNFHW